MGLGTVAVVPACDSQLLKSAPAPLQLSKDFRNGGAAICNRRQLSGDSVTPSAVLCNQTLAGGSRLS
jgi:hypothetical protein